MERGPAEVPDATIEGDPGTLATVLWHGREPAALAIEGDRRKAKRFLGLFPLPVRYHLLFGEPMHFEGDANEDDAAIERRVSSVRDAIHALLKRGLAERRGVFR